MPHRKKGFTPEGYQKVAVGKSYQDKSLTLVSFNFANTRTWWQGSTRVEESLSLEDDNQTVLLTQGSGGVVNIYEIADGLSPNHQYSPEDYKVQVILDGEDISAYEYGYEAGQPIPSDPRAYQVDYALGRILFDNSQSPSSLSVSYSLPGPGVFKLSAPPDTQWRVHHIELQFSVPHGAWANPMEFVMGFQRPDVAAGTPTPVMLKTYRGMGDILNFANLGSPVPACGELTHDLYQVPFSYLSGFIIFPLDHAFDLEQMNAVNYVELRMKYGLPIPDCELATASFYVFEEEV